MKAVIALFLCSTVSLPATIDFDSFADSEILTNQVPGLTFAQAIVLSETGSLNTLFYVPASSPNVLADFGGPIDITFDSPVLGASALFTYSTALTLEAFDINSVLVASANSLLNDNTLPGTPNESIGVSYAGGIARLVITGDPFGGSFAMDDLQLTQVPEPCSLILLGLLLLTTMAASAQTDLTHFSTTFQETRNYRIFLPADYGTATSKRYPVIYWFHGFGERFNTTSGEIGDYDLGYSGDNIASYVASHDVIVVRPDGYNPRFAGDNRPRPYNACPLDQPSTDCAPGDTSRDFAAYFVELASFIDANYRTIPDRDHRATTGDSMGGWMSYWLASKYPDLIGSASSFMGGPEFVVGASAFATEWAPTFLYSNFEGQRTRFVTGSQDFIRWYHHEMHKVWNYARSNHEVENFDWPHGTPGIAKTLDFHMHAFASPLAKPAAWSHAEVHSSFQVWGYSVNTDRIGPGFTILENVSASGFRSSVREFLPNGRLLSQVAVSISTDPIYVPGADYQITDVDLDLGRNTRSVQKADPSGKLSFTLQGNRHEIGITAAPAPVLAVTGWRQVSPGLPMSGQTLRFRFTIANKGSAPASGITVPVSSPNPQIAITPALVTAPNAAAGQIVETSQDVAVTISDPQRQILTLDVNNTRLYIPLVPNAPDLSGVSISDGATRTLWQQAIQQASVTMGKGNADGIPAPGESVALHLLDGGAYRAGEVLAADSCIDLTVSRNPKVATDYTRVRLRDQWASYDFVGGTQKYSLPIISATCAAGRDVSLFVRFILPNAPDHIIQQGVVKLHLAGLDTTPPEVLGAQLRAGNRLEVQIRDGGLVTSATARLTGPGGTLSFPLQSAAGDGVFSALISPILPGTYSLLVSSMDNRGNAADVNLPGSFVF